MSQHFDYICLGAGSGGIASANRAAMYGAKVLLIEARHIGGTCVNVGCVPKKVMWYSAQVAEAIHLFAGDYGWDVAVKKFDWNYLVNNREAYIERIHGSYKNTLANNGVTLINGFGRFVNNTTIEVNGGQYRADHILIATGSVPVIPDIPGASYGIDSDGFLRCGTGRKAWLWWVVVTLRQSWRVCCMLWAVRRVCLFVNTHCCVILTR